MSDTRTTRALRFAAVVAFGLIVLSATGTATPKTVARLGALGIEAGTAGMILHVAPVLFGTLVCGLGQFAVIGRSQAVRFSIYALLGLTTGFVMGLSLDLFTSLGGWISGAFGPEQPKQIHLVGWAIAGISTLWALMMAAIAILGTPAARALQDIGSDPECAEVRPRDRRISGAGAYGMLATGLSLGGLTVLDQTGASGTPGIALAAFSIVTGALSVASSWSIWRQADEFQQRAILQAHAAALIVLTAGAFIWTAAQGFGLRFTLSAYEIFTACYGVQMVTAIAASLAGSHSGSAAPSRRRAA